MGNYIKIPTILFIFLLFFFIYKISEDKGEIEQKYENLTKDYVKLNNSYNKLMIDYSDLQQEYDTLRLNYEELEKESTQLTQLLLEYVAKETLWDFIGIRKLRILCNILKITLRDVVPESQKLPC